MPCQSTEARNPLPAKLRRELLRVHTGEQRGDTGRCQEDAILPKLPPCRLTSERDFSSRLAPEPAISPVTLPLVQMVMGNDGMPPWSRLEQREKGLDPLPKLFHARLLPLLGRHRTPNVRHQRDESDELRRVNNVRTLCSAVKTSNSAACTLAGHLRARPEPGGSRLLRAAAPLDPFCGIRRRTDEPRHHMT